MIPVELATLQQSKTLIKKKTLEFELKLLKDLDLTAKKHIVPSKDFETAAESFFYPIYVLKNKTSLL